MPEVAPNTIVVWSDLACPWATVAVHRLHEARERAGLVDAVAFDHRAFCLEVINDQPTPKRILDAEVPVVGALAPELGWRVWRAPEAGYAVSTLLALEAVQVAKEQGLEASARLDRALRAAFFAGSRCVTMRHVVLEVAAECDGVDAGALREALDAGRGRRAVLEQTAAARDGKVQGSPHLFLPDGSDVHNPGVEKHWLGEPGEGFPVVDADDPSVYDDLVRRAAG